MEWAAWLDAPHAELARQVLQRGTAAVFAVALLSTLLQFPALLGEHGLQPAPRYIAAGGLDGQPSIFRWHYSDRFLRILCLVCIAIALALVAGLPQAGPPWLPLLAFLVLWIVYLSILPIGQVFYGFGWELLLCEAGFLVAFLGSAQHAPPTLALLLIVWLVFRLEFGAGMIKLRGGREWRDLTALMYHHETQPMPGPLSRWAHLAPAWWHRLEVIGNHVAQLVAPWVLLVAVLGSVVADAVGAGARDGSASLVLAAIATGAAAIMILTQGWLVITGNFAWLNWITIVLGFAAVDDRVVAWLLPAWPSTRAYEPTPVWFSILVAVVFLWYVWLSIPSVRNLASRRQLMNASFNRLRLANAYGAFGTVTKRRDEIVIEGTLADAPRDDDWVEYAFKGKPGDVRRVPGWFAPYHLRLDWLMWFLALGSHGLWFEMLLVRLLEADRPTLRLLAGDPFDGRRPRWVRARVYRYRFATRAERRETGQWWMREGGSVLVPPVGAPRPSSAADEGDPG
ncbi:lipase maturation factor family protein [Agrococcus sp. HG114]|uniref:lipase maturation factor family protein n=1 Tax=Agrococcus sp. HG114 TaxID=2969757 RepID=UPI00215B41FB|nr:lipase maturation factor family protein [Agrococcus sp. HG114]MCR8669615.1 lipase maturation factor family protein [Agrococcus sp. HG114]